MARKTLPTLVYLKNDVREFPDAVRAMEFVKKLGPDRALVWDLSYLRNVTWPTVEYVARGEVVAQVRAPHFFSTDEVASHMPAGSITKRYFPYSKTGSQFKPITEYRTFYVEYSVQKERDLVEYKEVRYRAFSALNLFDLCMRCRNSAAVWRVGCTRPTPEGMPAFLVVDPIGDPDAIEEACVKIWGLSQGEA